MIANIFKCTLANSNSLSIKQFKELRQCISTPGNLALCVSIESVDEQKRIWLYPLGLCEFEASRLIAAIRAADTGHKEATHSTPETSSFLTIKQNKNQ